MDVKFGRTHTQVKKPGIPWDWAQLTKLGMIMRTITSALYNLTVNGY